jgi:hypothetical protein
VSAKGKQFMFLIGHHQVMLFLDIDLFVNYFMSLGNK